MSVYICHACTKMVDIDTEETNEECINNTLCMNCQDSDNAQQWVDNNPIEKEQ